jgi:choline transport protein
MPTTVSAMNYNSVILVGVIALSAVWWLLHATRHYPGPKVMHIYIHDDAGPLNQTGALGLSHQRAEVSKE